MWRKKIKMIGIGQQSIQAKNKAHESTLPKELDRIGLELINTTATFDGKVSCR